jgi:transcriptional regulator with XRE-family HTH domain
MTVTRLKKARKKRGWTTREVADAVGVDQSQLSRVENAKKRASPELAARLHTHFGGDVTRDEILFPEYYPVDVEAGARKPVQSQQLREA